MPKETNLFSQHTLSLRIQSNFVEQGLYLFVFYKCFRVFSSYIFGKEPLPTLLSSKYQVQKNPRYYFSFDALNNTGGFPSSQTLEKYSLPSPSTRLGRLSIPVLPSPPGWPDGCAAAAVSARHCHGPPRCQTAFCLSARWRTPEHNGTGNGGGPDLLEPGLWGKSLLPGHTGPQFVADAIAAKNCGMTCKYADKVIEFFIREGVL